MSLFFVHVCPYCRRNQQVPVKRLGATVACSQCGKTTTAEDQHGQSLAMTDSMKMHAMLAADIESSCEVARRPR